MKAPFSPYLTSIAPGIKRLIELLGNDYEYVSALASDSTGFAVQVSRHGTNVGGRTMTTERGIVVRVYKDKKYSEYSLNRFDPDAPEKAYEEIRAAFAAQEEILKATGTEMFETAVLSDEPCTLFVEKETQELPEEADIPDRSGCAVRAAGAAAVRRDRGHLL